MKKKLRKSLTIISAVIILLIVYVTLCFAKSDNVVWESTAINGVLIEGMTKEEAESAVEEAFAKDVAEASLSVLIGEETYAVPLDGTLSIDAKDAVEEAYAVGHGPWFLRGLEWINAELTNISGKYVELSPIVSDEEALRAAVEGTGLPAYDDHKETTWDVVGNELIIHKGERGEVPDIDALVEDMKKTLASGDLEGPIPCPTTDVAFSDVDFAQIARDVFARKQDPYMDSNYEIVPAQTGIELDPKEAAAVYEKTKDGEDGTVPLTVNEPSMTTEEYESLLFRDRLSGCQTHHYSLSGRDTNLAIACAAIDGTIVLPGEVFSYNDTVGDITAERGFKAGDAYSNGRVITQIGGGVCQVASTIYASLLYTDIEIVEQRNHSMLVYYLPLGFDATVYAPKQDFKFRNNRDYPIRINAGSENGDVYIGIYGTAIEGEPEVNAYTVPVGTLAVRTYREFLDANGEVIETEDRGVSKYKAKAENDDDEDEDD